MKLINQINNFFRKNKKDNSQLLSEITEPNQGNTILTLKKANIIIMKKVTLNKNPQGKF